MTKKHFKVIADVLRDVREDYGDESMAVEAVSAVAIRLASRCQEFNANFDKTRFLKACGITR